MKLIIPEKDRLIVTSEHDVAESRYHSKNPIIQKIYRSRLQAAVDFIENSFIESGPSRVLEIGCGSGVLTPTLQAIGKEVISVDIHDKLDLVKEKIPGDYVQASIFELPFQEKFDCILCLSVLEHLEGFERALIEVKRHLTEKGIVILGFPSDNFFIKSWLWLSRSPAYHNHINGKNILLELISRHYHIVGKKTLRLVLPDYYTVVKCESKL